MHYRQTWRESAQDVHWHTNMPYVPFPLDEIALKAPVPVNVWDPNGVLLLRRGEVIHDEKHRDRLHMHLPMVDEAEYKAWTFRYTATIDRMVRGNQSLDAIAGVTRPMGVEALQNDHETSAAEVWPDLHDALNTLMYQGAQATDFLKRLASIERRMDAVLRLRADDSLFVLMQLLQDRTVSYHATHALLCSVLCRLVAQTLPWTEAERTSLQRAALTMNVGMSRLHDALAHQAEPLNAAQRQQVLEHAQGGAQVLASLGVQDTFWLHCVRGHHQPELNLPGDAVQGERAMATLLHLADVYVARVSPRTTRPGLPASRAARDVYLGADGQPTPLGAAFVKALGAYIPGSYVRLASGEVGVVVRRGRRANTPLVLSVIGRHGMPLGEPALRDTHDAPYAVKGSVIADEVKVRLTPSRVLARL